MPLVPIDDAFKERISPPPIHEQIVQSGVATVALIRYLTDLRSSGKNIYDEVNRVIEQVNLNIEEINSLQEELDNTQEGAGLEDDGSYLPSELSNYINTATSLYKADLLLDTAIEDAMITAGTADAKANQSLSLGSKLSHLVDLLSTSPAKTEENFQNLDYINFNKYGKSFPQVGQAEWNREEDTLNIHHTGGVTQQVGQETYARVINNTGSPILNGEVLGFSGVGAAGEIEVQKFIADGSISSIYILGVATQDIPDGEKGRATVWGYLRDINSTGTPYGETWINGDILYASPFTAGRLTNIKPTAPLLVIPMAIVTSIDATDGTLFARTTVDQPLYYGTFADTTSQSPAAVNTAYPITINTIQQSDGFYIGTPASRVYSENAGFYSFQFSAQVTSTSASTKTLWFWARVNGVDIPNSSMKVSISNNNFTQPLSRSVSLSMNKGDYLEAMWAADDVTVSLDAAPATAFAPAAPSVILAIHEITQ